MNGTYNIHVPIACDTCIAPMVPQIYFPSKTLHKQDGMFHPLDWVWSF